MGASIKYVSRKRRDAALKRAVWNFVESEVDDGLNVSAVTDVVCRICEAVRFVVEDMNTVGELNRTGFPRRHWYTIGLDIGEDRVSVQNRLERAKSSPPLPPGRRIGQTYC